MPIRARTANDQLQVYRFDKIFSGCRIVDIHKYFLEKVVKLRAGGNGYLYHDPCHTPMKLQEPMKTVKALLRPDVALSKRCCGESGILGEGIRHALLRDPTFKPALAAAQRLLR